MKEIEAAAPVSLGYPHVILACRDDQHVGPTNPTFISMWSPGFEGVEEPKVRAPLLLDASDAFQSHIYPLTGHPKCEMNSAQQAVILDVGI